MSSPKLPDVFVDRNSEEGNYCEGYGGDGVHLDSLGASAASGTGLSQQAAEPEVSALRASIPDADERIANAVEAHGEALFAFSAIMLKRKLFPEKGNALTEAYEEIVLSWGKLAGECARGDAAVDLLREMHTAFCEIAMLRRMATYTWERDMASRAHAVRERVEAFLAQAIEAREGHDPQGHGAKHESAVAEGHALGKEG